jgi:hypothetical protein
MFTSATVFGSLSWAAVTGGSIGITVTWETAGAARWGYGVVLVGGILCILLILGAQSLQAWYRDGSRSRARKRADLTNL